MKKDDAGKIIILTDGEMMRKPEGVPDEAFGTPEVMDWRTKAFELAREVESIESERRGAENVITVLDNQLSDLRRRLEQIESRVEVRIGMWLRRVWAWLWAKIKALRERFYGNK